MRNSLLEDLLSYGVQLIDENNGKYTFLLAHSPGSFVCPPLFDRSIPVGSLIVVKVLTESVDSGMQYDIALLVACNSSTKDNHPEILVKNNIFWVDLSNFGFSVIPCEEPK